jgi:hypothetical protein
MKKILLVLWMMFATVQAETVFAEPAPSFDNPRQVVFCITDKTDDAIHHVLSSANNVLKFYGPENVHMRIVAYSGGIRALKKTEKDIAVRVDALIQYDVEFVACGNTMRTYKMREDELIDGTEIVTAGIVEMIERVKEGWIYIRP